MAVDVTDQAARRRQHVTVSSSVRAPVDEMTTPVAGITTPVAGMTSRSSPVEAAVQCVCDGGSRVYTTTLPLCCTKTTPLRRSSPPQHRGGATPALRVCSSGCLNAAVPHCLSPNCCGVCRPLNLPMPWPMLFTPASTHHPTDHSRGGYLRGAGAGVIGSATAVELSRKGLKVCWSARVCAHTHTHTHTHGQHPDKAS